MLHFIIVLVLVCLQFMMVGCGDEIHTDSGRLHTYIASYHGTFFKAITRAIKSEIKLRKIN